MPDFPIKKFYLNAVLVLLILVLGFLANYQMQIRQNHDITRKEGQAILQIGEKYTTDKVSHYLGHGTELAKMPQVVEYLERLSTGQPQDPALRQRVNTVFLRTSGRHSETDSIRLLSQKGNDVLVVKDHQISASSAAFGNNTAFQKAVKSGKPALRLRTMGSENLIQIFVPVYGNGQMVGVLLIVYNARVVTDLLSQLALKNIIDDVFILRNQKFLFSSNAYTLSEHLAPDALQQFSQNIQKIGFRGGFSLSGDYYLISTLPYLNVRLGVVTYEGTIRKNIENILLINFFIFSLVFILISIVGAIFFFQVTGLMKEHYRIACNSETHVQTILHLMRNMLFILHADSLSIIRVNQAVFLELGYQDQDLLNHSIEAILDREDPQTQLSLTEMIKSKTVSNLSLTFRHKDGYQVPVIFSSSLVHNQIINQNELICVAQNITKQKQVEEKLNFIAEHDELTKLSNRMRFNLLLDEKFAAAKSDRKQLTLFYIDVDDFKSVNDTYGHAFGDLYLSEIANHMVQILRSDDAVFRLAGDEFAILTDELQTRELAERLADRLIKTVHIKTSIAGVSITPSISIGIALYPTMADTADKLIQTADDAMYTAKKAGGNQYRFAPELAKDA